MGWKSFTEEEILELKSNKYTHTVSASTISFTAEFKEKFWAMYKTGYKPKQILGQLGYNPDILGHNRIGGIRAHIREQALSAEGFHEGRRELIPKRPIEEYAEMRLFDRDGVNGAKFSLMNNFKGWRDKPKDETELEALHKLDAILEGIDREAER